MIFFSFILYFVFHKNHVRKILIASFLKSVHLIPETTAWNPFSTPIPAISHLVVFGFNPKKSENTSQINFSD